MTVASLWPVLAPCVERVPLASLCGWRVAVDASVWVVEAAGQRHSDAPEVSNTFYRVASLLRHGVRVAAVVFDGRAPRIKRSNSGRGSGGAADPSGRLHAPSRRVAALLERMGVAAVHLAEGEAEAYCAAMVARGEADACLTPDADALLFGAACVIRRVHPAKGADGPVAELVRAARVRDSLGLGRAELVAAALLLGSDYAPGVRGVGPSRALRLLADPAVRARGALTTLLDWAGDGAPREGPHRRVEGCSATVALDDLVSAELRALAAAAGVKAGPRSELLRRLGALDDELSRLGLPRLLEDPEYRELWSRDAKEGAGAPPLPAASQSLRPRVAAAYSTDGADMRRAAEAYLEPALLVLRATPETPTPLAGLREHLASVLHWPADKADRRVAAFALNRSVGAVSPAYRPVAARVTRRARGRPVYTVRWALEGEGGATGGSGEGGVPSALLGEAREWETEDEHEVVRRVLPPRLLLAVSKERAGKEKEEGEEGGKSRAGRITSYFRQKKAARTPPPPHVVLDLDKSDTDDDDLPPTQPLPDDSLDEEALLASLPSRECSACGAPFSVVDVAAHEARCAKHGAPVS